MFHRFLNTPLQFTNEVFTFLVKPGKNKDETIVKITKVKKENDSFLKYLK